MSRGEAAAFVRKSSLPYFHVAGACVMGSHGDAAVDAELRVHGTDRLPLPANLREQAIADSLAAGDGARPAWPLHG